MRMLESNVGGESKTSLINMSQPNSSDRRKRRTEREWVVGRGVYCDGSLENGDLGDGVDAGEADA
jgi:hypothetical protein